MSDALTQSDIDAIAQARQSFMTAVAEDDVDTMTSLLTEDGEAYPPHEPALLGKEANRAWHAGRVGEFHTAFNMTTEEVFGEGSMAFERFSWSMKLTPKAGGDPIEDSGQCFWLWKREGDSWKVARAMWNGPHPLPEVPEA